MCLHKAVFEKAGRTGRGKPGREPKRWALVGGCYIDIDKSPTAHSTPADPNPTPAAREGPLYPFTRSRRACG